MELPDDVLSIIRDFSRPVTRPDWRKLKPMTGDTLHYQVAVNYNIKHIPVIERFVERYDQANFIYMFHLGYIANAVNVKYILQN